MQHPKINRRLLGHVCTGQVCSRDEPCWQGLQLLKELQEVLHLLHPLGHWDLGTPSSLQIFSLRPCLPSKLAEREVLTDSAPRNLEAHTAYNKFSEESRASINMKCRTRILLHDSGCT